MPNWQEKDSLDSVHGQGILERTTVWVYFSSMERSTVTILKRKDFLC